MAHDINSALERLEANLQNIDSARQQVENTIAASNALQIKVKEYPSSLTEMCDKVKETSSNFESKTKDSLQKFVEQNNKLTEHVQNLKSLRDEIVKTSTEIQEVKSLLSQISNDLKNSQKEQDDVLKRIDHGVTELPNKLNSIVDAINTISESLMKEIDIKEVNILSHISSLSSLCQNIKSDIDSTNTSLLTAIDKTKKDTANAINISRWIVILGFTILAILLVVLK